MGNRWKRAGESRTEYRDTVPRDSLVRLQDPNPLQSVLELCSVNSLSGLLPYNEHDQTIVVECRYFFLTAFPFPYHLFGTTRHSSEENNSGLILLKLFFLY